MDRAETVILEILDPVNFDQPPEITGFEGIADRNASIEELLRSGTCHVGIERGKRLNRAQDPGGRASSRAAKTSLALRSNLII
jgi:hypothetical protein